MKYTWMQHSLGHLKVGDTDVLMTFGNEYELPECDEVKYMVEIGHLVGRAESGEQGAVVKKPKKEK